MNLLRILAAAALLVCGWVLLSNGPTLTSTQYVGVVVGMVGIVVGIL